MSHRKDLTSKGFKSVLYGTKSSLQKSGKKMKATGVIKQYRVVPFDNKHELYIKK